MINKPKKQSNLLDDLYILGISKYLNQLITQRVELVLSNHTPDSVLAFTNQELNPVYWDIKNNIQQVIDNVFKDYKIPLESSPKEKIIESEIQKVIDLLNSRGVNLENQLKSELLWLERTKKHLLKSQKLFLILN